MSLSRGKAFYSIRILASMVILFLAQYVNARGIDTTMHYQVNIKVIRNIPTLFVQVRFHTGSAAPVHVQEPRDYFGTTTHRYISDFQGIDGTTFLSAGDSLSKDAVPDAGMNISISYVIAYDPRPLEGNTYAPNMDSIHFHLAACQWMLIIGDLYASHRYDINFSIPQGWAFYCSASPDKRSSLSGSYDDLFRIFWGGGLLLHQKSIHSRTPCGNIHRPAISGSIFNHGHCHCKNHHRRADGIQRLFLSAICGCGASEKKQHCRL